MTATTQATFCATLVDEWARAGVRHAVVAPGSRSTPLALALVADGRLDVQVHHDERCAAFMALGVGVATGVPAVLLCTSGTAATHFHAAVVEAHHAHVPLLVCTADRPPELRDVGAPQAIDQSHLYGRAVRWFFDPGPPDEAMRSAWRSIAARAFAAAADGPVHLNLPFREPLVGEAGELPPPVPGAVPTLPPLRLVPPRSERPRRAVPPVGGRGLIVVGGAQEVELDAVATGIPLLVEPRSGVSGGRAAITHVDALLRVPELRDELRPDVAVRLDQMPASRLLAEWLADVPGVGDADEPVPDGWLERWRQLDDAADAAIAAVLADHPEPTEPGTARTLLQSLRGGALVVASSMPIRDLEWYGGPRGSVRVLANRGANGIDGTMSTAIGVARATGQPMVCLLGDVAFLHDSNALIGIADRRIDLTIVVIDNDGGGIFSFLPQATTLPADRFELLFGTPHGVRPEQLAAAHGLLSVTVEAADALAPAIEASRAAGGVRLVVVRTDRAANVRLHEELHAAVAVAVRALG